jgi:hypothetical protein
MKHDRNNISDGYEFTSDSSENIIFWIIRNYGRFSRIENQQWYIEGKKIYEDSLENKNEGEIKKALGGWLQEYTPDTQKSRAKR